MTTNGRTDYGRTQFSYLTVVGRGRRSLSRKILLFLCVPHSSSVLIFLKQDYWSEKEKKTVLSSKLSSCYIANEQVSVFLWIIFVCVYILWFLYKLLLSWREEIYKYWLAVLSCLSPLVSWFSLLYVVYTKLHVYFGVSYREPQKVSFLIPVEELTMTSAVVQAKKI